MRRSTQTEFARWRRRRVLDATAAYTPPWSARREVRHGVAGDIDLPFTALPINPPPQASLLIDLDAFRKLGVTAVRSVRFVRFVRFVRIANSISGTHVYLDASGALRVSPAPPDTRP